MAVNDETQHLKRRQSRKYPLGSSVDHDMANKPYLLIYTILYGCENLVLTLEKESKLRKFERKVLIIIF